MDNEIIVYRNINWNTKIIKNQSNCVTIIFLSFLIL